ncbi:uncharacterized protein PgNI_09216 [Pyricularia grisea]|uniref:Uncharacterized protein n=1 Tax=Pyricularia grisea TaxID=148305 RepID=A0A6P8ATH9_PYRGI|nr:uncharacterized protein PgNI_09216 [Pyricularia grisea]TLD05392.1 hypothetical protein PgNI_09216 [Pyricularia grisea]
MRILSVALLAFLLQPVVPAPTPEPLVDSIVTPSIVLSGVALGCDHVRDATRTWSTSLEKTIGKIRKIEPNNDKAYELEENLKAITYQLADTARSSKPPILPVSGSLVEAYQRLSDTLRGYNQEADAELKRLKDRNRGNQGNNFLSWPEGDALEAGLRTPSSPNYWSSKSRSSPSSSSPSSPRSGVYKDVDLKNVGNRLGGFKSASWGSRKKEQSLLPIRNGD